MIVLILKIVRKVGFEQRMKCKVMLRSSSEYIFLEREQCCGNINKIAHSELD